MEGVSGRAVAFALEGARACGLSPDSLIEGLDLTVEKASLPSQRLPWEAFVTIVQRLGDQLGGPDELVAFGRRNASAESMRIFQRVGRALSHPDDLYRMGVRWMGPALFPMIRARIEELPGGRLRETLSIEPGLPDCPELFHVMQGAFIAIPRAYGHDESIVDLELRPNQAILTIEPRTSSSGWLGRTIRAIHRRVAFRSMMREIEEQQASIHESYWEIRTARDRIEAQAEQLARVNSIGRQLSEHIEIDRVADVLVSTVIGELGIAGVELWLLPPGTNAASEARSYRTGGRTEGEPTSRYPLASAGRPVGTLVVWRRDGGLQAAAKTFDRTELSATGMEPSATEMEPSATGVEPSAAEMEPSATEVEPSAAGMQPSATGTDPSASETAAHDVVAIGRPPAPSDESAELLERLLPWISMALDNGRIHAELQSHAADLEHRVKERTARLLAANHHLVREIDERKRATDALIESEAQLRASERLASVGTLAAGIAHEINNPIGSILAAAQFAQVLDRSLEGQGSSERREIRKALEDIETEAKRCGGIVRSVLQFSRDERTEKWDCRLGDVLVRSIRLYKTRAFDERPPQIDLSLPATDVWVHVNPIQIEQAIVNLIANAVEAGSSQVRVHAVERPEERVVSIGVLDNGPGIPADDRLRIFEPFYTTKRDVGGTGLGLSVVHGIAAEHGGRLKIEGGLEGGAAALFELPSIPAPPIPLDDKREGSASTPL